MIESKLSKEEKQLIIEALIKDVDVQIFKLTCAHSANQRVGAAQESLKPLVDELTRLEGLRLIYIERLEKLAQEE